MVYRATGAFPSKVACERNGSLCCFRLLVGLWPLLRSTRCSLRDLESPVLSFPFRVLPKVKLNSRKVHKLSVYNTCLKHVLNDYIYEYLASCDQIPQRYSSGLNVPAARNFPTKTPKKEDRLIPS